MSRNVDIPAVMRRTVMWTAGGLGVEGLFSAFAAHADLAIITAAWTGMLVTLADQADLNLGKDQALKIATGVVVGIGGMAAGVKAANAFFAYTGVGTLPAMLCNAGTNGTVTYMVGMAAARVFMSEGKDACIEEIIRAIVRMIRPNPHRPTC